MKLERLGVKFFVENPLSVEIRNFVPVFHSWIQKQVIEDHLLIDVHDYSHIYQGPGILLVAHEGNFSMDLGQDRLGLFYYRKQPLNGPPLDRLKTIFLAVLQGCRLLSKGLPSENRVQFKTDEVLLVANDRLHHPNTQETFQQLQPVLSRFITQLFETQKVTLTHQGDPKERFSVALKTACGRAPQTLLRRLSEMGH